MVSHTCSPPTAWDATAARYEMLEPADLVLSKSTEVWPGGTQELKACNTSCILRPLFPLTSRFQVGAVLLVRLEAVLWLGSHVIGLWERGKAQWVNNASLAQASRSAMPSGANRKRNHLTPRAGCSPGNSTRLLLFSHPSSQVAFLNRFAQPRHSEMTDRFALKSPLSEPARATHDGAYKYRACEGCNPSDPSERNETPVTPHSSVTGHTNRQLQRASGRVLGLW
ncbi:hypothetical protein QBC34DRAFT_177287 [Podospora aff. communis PSN243]|uniref:Uncharacterized protein n=1 Tax=Podospora aff. communis PSN243 TaxID=3040156 RepID=A0AAV9GYP0_9PEZI|nr:hypothetical protein QBC34DRAFT_177287 [Podospora aff. communis PSN243]